MAFTIVTVFSPLITVFLIVAVFYICYLVDLLRVTITIERCMDGDRPVEITRKTLAFRGGLIVGSFVRRRFLDTADGRSRGEKLPHNPELIPDTPREEKSGKV